MISDFGALLAYVLKAFQIEFTIYGFTFSLWQVLLFTIVAGIICFILREVFLGD